MGDGYSDFGTGDKGGRRSGIDRRKLVNPEHMINRRSGQDRRTNLDRRTGHHWENLLHLRRSTDRYMEFAKTQKGLMLGVLLSVPVWALIIAKVFKLV
jgi:hypothetical protein